MPDVVVLAHPDREGRAVTADHLLTGAEYRGLVAARMTEAQLQAMVVTAARTLGWLVYHTHDSRRSQPGFPDLVLVHPVQRRVLWRELKTERGRVSSAQDEWIHALTRAGQDVAVWRPADYLDGSVLADLQMPPAPTARASSSGEGGDPT